MFLLSFSPATPSFQPCFRLTKQQQQKTLQHCLPLQVQVCLHQSFYQFNAFGVCNFHDFVSIIEL